MNRQQYDEIHDALGTVSAALRWIGKSPLPGKRMERKKRAALHRANKAELSVLHEKLRILEGRLFQTVFNAKVEEEDK